MKKNLLLIGMPGSGKSTIGKELAQQYDSSFIDTDKLIEEQEKIKLQTIINTHGIDKAREIEKKYLQKINVEGYIIATGGSAIYYPEAMQHFKKNSIIVFLNVSLEELVKRITNFETRGIIMQKDQTFEDIFNEREKLYKKYADFTITNEGKNLERILEEIKKGYKKYA